MTMNFEILKNRMGDFLNFYPKFKEFIYKNFPQDNKLFCHEFINKVDYYVLGGRQIRGNLCLAFYFYFTKVKNLEQELEKLYLIAWCLEMFHGYALAADDICDAGNQRRNKPSAYKQFGLSVAVSDISLAHSLVSHLLSILIKDEVILDNIMKLMGEQIGLVGCAMVVEIEISKIFLDKKFANVFDINSYNRQRLSFFWMCAGFGLCLAGYGHQDLVLIDAKDIVELLAEWYQIQDDYLDVFGDPAKMKKKGLDIKNGMFTWCIVTAVNLSNDCEHKVLQEYYGKNDDYSESKVIEIFKKVDIPKKYREIEDEIVKIMQKKVADYNLKYSIDTKLYNYLIEMTIKQRV